MNVFDLMIFSALFLNSITSIVPGAFRGLSRLRELYVSAQSSLPRTSSWCSDLSANFITSLESGVFEGLQSLQGLEAQNNMITSIAGDVFRHTPLLQKLFATLTLPDSTFFGINCVFLLLIHCFGSH